jgi:plastocyanin
MRNIETGRSVDFTGSALGLVAIVLVMTLSGAAASPASQPRGASGMTASPEASTGASATEVMIDHFAFLPGVVTVRAGTQVTWINHDDIPHTVDSTQGKFKSAAMDTADKFQFRFTEPGEYPFYCRMHPKMTGKIIVQPQW